MKYKFFVIVAFLSIAVTSCKKENKETTEPSVVEDSVKQNFSVEIDATAEAKDDFAVYFTEDGTNNFSGEKTAWRGIAGGATTEKLVFDLPEEITPTLIRLDFGMNKEQGDIIIENVKMDFGGNSFSFKGSDFFNYFIKTEEFSTEIDPAKGTLKILKGKKGFKTPYFYPTQMTIDAIAKITTGSK